MKKKRLEKEILMINLENDLNTYYKRFDANHMALKNDFMATLAAAPVKYEKTVNVASNIQERSKLAFAIRAAISMAAVFVIAFGVMFISPSNEALTVLDPKTAWADAITKTTNINSVYLRAHTGDSHLDMWWRSPDTFRMEFSNGIIITHNSELRSTLNTKANLLTLSEGGNAGFEYFILGELGQMFVSDKFPNSMANQRKIISHKEIEYKNEKCLELQLESTVDPDKLYRSVISEDGSMIYELNVMNKSNPKKVLYKVEVFEINHAMEDSLFEIEMDKKYKVEDRR